MTIKEVEERTGLSRSNVRFYEKEDLIAPSRNEGNGYRDYSDSDIENIKKIAYLRTLGISIEEIRNIISDRISLREAIRKQNDALQGQITELNRAKALCEKMLDAENMTYEGLQVEQYVTQLEEHWKDSRQIFKLDAVSFMYLWGGLVTWMMITVLCFAAGLLSYTKLPPEIPIQWSDGAVSSTVDKKFIFAYPIVCIAIRCLIRPWIYAKLHMSDHDREVVAEYLTNYMCFVLLSVEIFSIFFVYGVIKNVVVVLIVDTAVLLGILLAGLMKKNQYGC